MLEHSPSTAGCGRPAARSRRPSAPEAEKFVRAKSQRLGIGGVLAAVWLAFVIVGRDHHPDASSKQPRSTAGLLAGQGIFKVSRAPARGRSATATTCCCSWRRARAARCSSASARSAFGLAVGGTLGLIAGYYRGRIDTVLTSVFNVLLAIPQFVLALSLVVGARQRLAIDKKTGNQRTAVVAPAEDSSC